MNHPATPVTHQQGGIAPLANITVAERAVARLMNRSHFDPGLGVMYGPSGWGKSIAAAWISARHRAYYVQAEDFWSKKSMLIDMARAIGLVDVKGTVSELARMIKEQLETSRRLLIIDEFDFVTDKDLVMAIFSLYEGSKASILLIGEEGLPQKLKRWEKFHGRVLDWFPAEPVGIKDARELSRNKFPDITVADDLLKHLVELAKGSVRRVSNNLGAICDEAITQGWDTVDLATWGSRPLQTGEAPVRRRGA